MSTRASTPVPEEPARSLLRRSQDRLAALFGVSHADREHAVGELLARTRRVAAGYWLQLLLALTIATLGLLLDSTAVIIGAMLVSPLMTPLVELGTGLAIGSPLLVVRSIIRIGGSVAVVVAAAAALTRLAPIQELTGEIGARTAPTLLDLAIASCCAIAAVYSTIRSGSETASTAAGTAIGIALVPPLCVVGYGLGTRQPAVATGAGLLFTANLCAILLFSVLAFTALGYARVDVAALEREHLKSLPDPGLATRAAGRVSVFSASRAGPVVRIAMPVLLTAAVYPPLAGALAQVSREVRVRSAVRAELRATGQDSVSSSIRVERGVAVVRVVTVGSVGDAALLRERISARVRSASGLDPGVEVVAVADAAALARAQQTLRDPAPLPPPPVAPADVADLRRGVEEVLDRWPAEAAGRLITWTLSLDREGRLRLLVLHVGEPLGSAGDALLGAAARDRLREPVQVVDVALSATPVAASPDDGERWLGQVVEQLARVAPFPDAAVAGCVVTPSGKAPLALADLPALREGRIATRGGDAFRFWWSTEGCEGGDDAGSDAESGGDAAE